MRRLAGWRIQSNLIDSLGAFWRGSKREVRLRGRVCGQIELEGPGAPKEAHAIMSSHCIFHRIEEACVLLNSIEGASAQEVDEVHSSPALAYFGSWGTIIDRFRAIPHGATITHGAAGSIAGAVFSTI